MKNNIAYERVIKSEKWYGCISLHGEIKDHWHAAMDQLKVKIRIASEMESLGKQEALEYTSFKNFAFYVFVIFDSYKYNKLFYW